MLTLLHAPTLGLIVTMMLMTIAGLMLFVLKTRTTYSGFGWWTTGFVLLAGCFLLSILRASLPQLSVVLGSNVLGIAGLCLLHDGIVGFYGRRKPRPDYLNWGVAALVVAAQAYRLYGSNDINARIVLFNAFQLFITVRILWRIVPCASGRQRSATLLVCAIFLGTAASALWRIVAAMQAAPLTDLLAQDVGYRLVLLISAMLTVMLAFSFLLLTHTRIEEELEEARAKAEHAARIDPLTGLWNRRHFELEALREMPRASRYAQPVSLVLFDIDHFKQVNDRHGHLAGDEALKQIAGIVRGNMRASDLVCRWGGEEFAILMPVTVEEAIQATEKLREAISQCELAPGGRLSISAGCAQWTAGEDLASWSRCADRALYQAKAGGRNRVEAFEQDACLAR